MVAIVGRGNVATHLFKALEGKTEVTMVNPHTLEDLPEGAELILICVSDKAIKDVFEKIPSSNAIIAHTAGSVEMNILQGKNERFGVLYPLQTFTKDLEMNYSDIPVFIEGNSLETESKLIHIASLFSNDVKKANSETRKLLHLASVFACNFTNALAGIAEEILNHTEFDFKVVYPLMKQTVDKLASLPPKDAQTGPAIRRDTNVIATQLRMLESHPHYADLYKILTDIIQK